MKSIVKGLIRPPGWTCLTQVSDDLARISTQGSRWRWLSGLVGCLCCFSLFGGVLHAQNLSQPNTQSVLKQIELAKQELSESNLPDTSLAADSLLQDWASLKRYLSSTADQDNQQAWLDYIGLQPLVELLEDNRTNDVWSDREKMISIYRLSKTAYWRLRRNQAGLEREPLMQLRQSIEKLSDALRFKLAGESNSVQYVSRALDRVSSLFVETQLPFNPEQLANLNMALEVIDKSGTAPQLVQRMTAMIGSPNIYISIGQKPVHQIITRPVSDSGPNNDCILGTRVISQTYLDGQLTPSLVPNPTSAQIQLLIDANFNSQGTGYNSGVKILNRSYGTVHSVRDIFISETGVSIGEVRSNANLETQILGIQHPWRIVRRIAAKKAANQRAAATRIAESRLESRITNQFAEQSAEQISEGNLLPKSAAQDVLNRLGLAQPEKHWSTSSDYVLLRMTVRSRSQVTTATPPPSVVPGFDLVIQFHETAIVNHATDLLAGRTLTDKEVRTFVLNLLPQDFDAGGIPLAQLLSDSSSIIEAGAEVVDEASETILGEELGLEEAAEQKIGSLEIQFEDGMPLIFEARDGMVRIGINVKSIVTDGEALRDPTSIWVKYKPVRNADGSVSLQRTDDVEILVKSATKLDFNIRQIPIVARLRGRLKNVFPEILLNRVLGESNAQLRKFSPDPLQVKAIKPRKGWLTVYAE